MENNVIEFIPLGISQEKEVEVLCILLFFICYIAILTGNLLIMGSVTCIQLINQPMYFFLNYSSFSDLCYTSTVTLKLIMDFLAEKKAISYNGCMTRLFTMHIYGGMGIFILTGMGYDHNVAICRHLHYSTVGRRRCNVIAASCAETFLHSVGQFFLAIFLPVCGPNEIDHYFCDVCPSLKLACADTSRIGLLVIVTSGLMSLVTFVILLISYAVILHSQVLLCGESLQSSFQVQFPYNCGGPVLFCFVLFFAPLLFIYIQSAPNLPEDKVFALFYTIFAPVLNRLIYALRNTEVKNAIKKLWFPIMGKKGNRVKDIIDSYHGAC